MILAGCLNLMCVRVHKKQDSTSVIQKSSLSKEILEENYNRKNSRISLEPLLLCCFWVATLVYTGAAF